MMMIFAALMAFSVGANASPVSATSSSTVVELKNSRWIASSKPFVYEDPDRFVLAVCRDGWVLLNVNGALNFLDVKSLQLKEVRGSKGFKFDRLFDSIYDKGDKITFIIHYEGGEGETARPDTHVLDVKKRSLVKVATEGWPGSDAAGTTNKCEPLPGVKVEVERDVLRIIGNRKAK